MKDSKKSLIRVSAQLHKLWVQAAAQEEVSRAAFLRLSLRERARRVLGETERGSYSILNTRYRRADDE